MVVVVSQFFLRTGMLAKKKDANIEKLLYQALEYLIALRFLSTKMDLRS